MKEKIVVIGGGGHAKVLISILKKLNQYNIVGFTDINRKESILGINCIGPDSILQELFSKGVKNAAIGIGQLKSEELRVHIYSSLTKIGFVLPVIISPKAVINEEVEIKEGTVVMDGAIINSSTRIGKCCIINTNSSIDHDRTIDSFTHIAPGVTLSGNVTVGKEVLIGTGAKIIQCVTLGDIKL